MSAPLSEWNLLQEALPAAFHKGGFQSSCPPRFKEALKICEFFFQNMLWKRLLIITFIMTLNYVVNISL